MKKLLTFLSVVIGLLTFETAHANNYYFSSSGGNDSYSSTQAQNPATPWKSLDKLNSFFLNLRPGDSVLFKCGDTFYGKLVIGQSGNSGSPIVLSSYGSGAKPVITGFTPVTSWKNIGGNIWESTNAVKRNNGMLNMVIINDNFQPIGRWPKVTASKQGYLNIDSHSGNTSITSSGLSGVPDYTGGQIVTRKNHWILDVDNITSLSGTTVNFTNSDPSYNIQNNFGFFFQNHANACTQQGDWYYTLATKKLGMYSNSEPSGVLVASIDTLVEVNQHDYITFHNLNIKGSNEINLIIRISHFINIERCDISYAGKRGIVITDEWDYPYKASNISIFNSTISYSNSIGLDVASTKNHSIKNNFFNKIGIVAGMGQNGDGQYMGVYRIGENSSFTFNTMDSIGYTALYFVGKNINISNNLIQNFCAIKDDGAGIYTYGNNNSGTTVSNNIVLNAIGNNNGTVGGTWAEGIYMDDGSNNVIISGNTVANGVERGIYIHNAHEIQILNNTCYNNNRQLYFLHDNISPSNPIRNIKLEGNIFVSKNPNQLVFGYSTISDDILSFGTADNNYYARPINEPKTFSIPGTDNTLAGWQSYSGQDAHSKSFPKTIKDVNDLRFEYNATQSPKTINLGATYIDVTGKTYSGSVTLQPYTSIVLLYQSGTVSNQPPVADAGPDQNFFLPVNSVTLNGSGSDPDGSITSYQWAKISGPSQYNIVSPGQAQTVVNNLAEGVYQFELTVTDDKGATGKDVVTVTVKPANNQAPTANAGPDQTITLPSNTVTLNGSGSDPDGSISSYQWTKISGPSQFSIASPNNAQTVVNSLVQGVYQFQLTVTDNKGATASSTVTITVNTAPNQPPTANAGSDQTITLPANSVTLNGSGNDPDGSIDSYQWTKISGPGQFSISSPTKAQTTVNNLAEGTYLFQLKVTDNKGATATSTVTITVNAAPNQPPTANAGSDQTITLPVNSVTLNGSGSDPDGSISSYQWTKISGPSQFNIVSPNNAQAQVTNLVQGTYQFQLMATDNKGATATDIVKVVVNAANQAPSADAGPDQTITLPQNSITLSGSGVDPDGTIASYQWNKISGPEQFNISSATQAQTNVNNLAQGAYQFELTVTDDQGATGKDTVRVVVNKANQAPVVNAGSNQNITLPADSVALSGSAYDPDGSISSYEWTRISGPSQFTIVSPSEAQTKVRNLTAGTYQFQLSVTDNQGATATSTVTITVNAAPNQAPVADAGDDQTITLPTNSVTLSGSGSDPDGTITAYRWRKISGPNSGYISNSNSSTATVSGLIQGVYQYELRVTDNKGAYGRDTVMVTVNPANRPPVANAGTNQSITLPVNSVTVSGSGNDPDGSIVSYEWTKVSGPDQYNIVSGSQAVTVIDNLVKGTYQFQLTVTDNDGATASDIVVVTVNENANQPPIADAGSNQTITLPANSVTLSGSGTDANGTITSYLWSKISGPDQFNIASPDQAQTSVTGLVEGTYHFQLTITDDQNETGIDVVIITVNPAANQAPVASAGPDQNITLPVDSITLSGSGTDQDGSVVSYQWSKISGPAQFNIVSNILAQTTVKDLVQGTYRFQLTVTDNSGATGTSVVTITVNPAPNQNPIANAGNDVTIYLPANSVALTGSGWDPDGSIVSYQWTKISGPTQFNIVSATQAQTTINNLVQGTYQFQFTVTDNNGATANDTIQVIVNPENIAPVANAGADKNITLPVNSVTLTGSGTDTDGTITAYLWTKISGPGQFTIVSPTRAQTIISRLTQGEYLFQLTVTDNLGATGADTVKIIVNPEANQPPTANAGTSQNITLPTNSVTLSGSGTDPDGSIVSYQWTKISGPAQFNIVSATQAKTVVNSLVQGTYQFRLTVTDDRGATASAIITVTVNPAPNQSPVANAGPNQNITLPNNSVTLNGSGSDPDGSIVSYQWTKISGPAQFSIASPTQAKTVINNLALGTYQFRLAVTDDRGATASATVTVTVNPAPNQAPSANAGTNQTITLPANSVTLNGSGSDPDGSIVSYQWTKISGPAQFSIASPAQAKTVVNNLVQGTYQFRLTVTDDKGATGTATVTVTVNPAPNKAPTANAGADQTITLPNNSVTLKGSGTDPDGTIVSYAWTRIAGPSQFSITSPSSSQTTVTSLVQGVYVFQLTVKDNSGATATALVTITVKAAVPPAAPTANAGEDKVIVLPVDYITLSGSGSTTNGSITSYAWTQVSGPSQSVVVSPSYSQTVVRSLVAGIYLFELTVTDSKGLTGKDTVQITVQNSVNRNVTPITAKLYPNPATTSITIEIDGATEKTTGYIKIYSVSGVVVYQEEFTRDLFNISKQIDVSSYANGIYFVNITLDTETKTTLKFVKQ